MGFECKNGGEWHPECTGCLCKPGFGGSDCGRCSSKIEMWPHVNRSANDYDNENINTSGTTFAAAACAIMSGIDPNAGPIGNGPMVDLNQSQCTEIEVLRPLPIQTANTTNTNTTTKHNNHTNLHLNVSSVPEQIFDCSFDPGDGLLSSYVGAYAKIKYGVVASDQCFDGSQSWAATDCDVSGNMSLDIYKATNLSPQVAKYKDHYSPHGIHCDLTECEQGEYDECVNNKVPKDFLEPCLKCKRISCVCPEHSMASDQHLFGDSSGCALTTFIPSLLPPGTEDSATYFGCSRSTGECKGFNDLLPFTFVMPYCSSSTCTAVPKRAPPMYRLPFYLLFYPTILFLLILTLILCLNATIVNTSKNGRSKRKGTHNGKGSNANKNHGSYQQRIDIRMEDATDAEEKEEKEVKEVNNSENSTNPNESATTSSSTTVHAINVIDVGYSINGKKLINAMNMTVWSGAEIDGIKPGVMAVMGPSGAGKTTFLDVISGRKAEGEVEGRVMLDGLELNASQRSRLFGYVMQEEPMLSCLTVRETLRFAADLRSRKRMNPRASNKDSLSMFSCCTSPFCCCSCVFEVCNCHTCHTCTTCNNNNAEEDVNRVMKMLSISHVADIRVGSTSDRTLSGGERKRVSVGTELVVDPPVLLLDEPTTGLDAASAMSVMNALHDLVVHHSRIVVATIHQPRVDIWNRLGGVTVVSPLGTVVYTGPAFNAPNYFTLDGELCRSTINPADHVIDAVAETSNSKLIQMTKECLDRFQSNTIRTKIATIIFNQGVVSPLQGVSRSSRTRLTQCCILCGRSNRVLFRDPTLVILQ